MRFQTCHSSHDVVQHIVKPSRHIQVRVAQHLDTATCEPAAARLVMLARIRFVVLPAIQFDGQPDRWRVEIEDATTRDVLTKKTNAVDLTQPQVLPQFAFGWRLVTPQVARASFHGCVIRHGLTLVRALQINRTTSPSVPFRKRRRSKASLLRNACKSHPPPFRRGKTSTMLRALSPPSERRGSTRSVGGMSALTRATPLRRAPARAPRPAIDRGMNRPRTGRLRAARTSRRAPRRSTCRP